MKTTKPIKAVLAFAILLASASTTSVLADPPTPVADMTKQELKIHERDVKKYVFEMMGEKEKSSGIYWLKSSEVWEELTPSISSFFRVGYRDDKLLSIQLVIKYAKYDVPFYKAEKHDFKTITLNGVNLSTFPQDGLVDVRSQAVLLMSSVNFTKATLEMNKDKGMLLKAISEEETIEVPVRPTIITAVLQRLEKHEAKLNKKKK